MKHNRKDMVGFTKLFLWLLLHGKNPYDDKKLSPLICYEVAKAVWLE